VFSLLEKRHGNALNLSSLAGLGLRTSMRNQLPCRIQSIETRASATWVQLELPNGALLLSKITQESAELLGLHLGMQALALCKASAVTVHTHADGLAEHNRLWGELMDGSRTEPGSEVSVRLAPGLQIVGFAGNQTSIEPGQAVVAVMDPAAVVIALGG
jgi:molybdate transport system regulatory protein